MKICCKCKIIKDFSEYHKDKTQNDGYQNKCKLCKKEYYKYDAEKLSNKYKNNKELMLKKANEYYKNNKIERIKYQSQYIRKKLDNDIIFKLRCTLRKRTACFLKTNKNRKSLIKDILGEEVFNVKIYLESKFLKGMTWENHGLYGWHIDHIIPLSSGKNEEEIIKLCHYTNLQPLWAKDNLKKSNIY